MIGTAITVAALGYYINRCFYKSRMARSCKI